ncbi:MAG: D-alanyl-D-alanine carboxypeptidase [Rhizobiales bacterium]|nr:D-alanyl-D-alanine carboxypeptidase [Hyphomicrobiales bacterium]NRB14934.1 D-alanyl-D-alanine carboxypeptidase [Hyphomicrobiales bacterium]
MLNLQPNNIHIKNAKIMALAMLTLLVICAQNITQAAELKTTAKYAYIYDVTNDTILYQKNSEILIPPASLSKLMTVYMIFEALRDGKVAFDDKFRISKRAYDRRGSSMFAQLKSKITIHNLIRGLIVVSGNDAAIAIAEGLAGSEEEFALQMQQKAREIGLTKSTFGNATGWPHENQKMTMRDLGHLANLLITEFPQYYHYFGETSLKWGTVIQPNRNILLEENIGVDGLKTGYTKESGYGIVTSAMRDGRRIIVAIHGLTSSRKRSLEAQKLLDWGYKSFKKYVIYENRTIVGQAKVALGKQPEIGLIVSEKIIALLNIDKTEQMTGEIIYVKPIVAPISRNQIIGQLNVKGQDGYQYSVPLLAEKHVAKSDPIDQSVDILWSWADKYLESLF